MSDFCESYTVQIGANGAPEIRNVGAYTYIYILLAPLPFVFALDGQVFNQGYQGLQLGPFKTNKTITFKAANGLASVVTFFVSSFPIAYFPNTAGIPTFPLGNLGMQANGQYNGQNVVFDGKYIQVDNNAGLTVNNVYGKFQRAPSCIVTCRGVYGQNWSSISLYDANGNGMMDIAPGSAVIVPTGGVFTIKSNGEYNLPAAGKSDIKIFENYYAL